MRVTIDVTVPVNPGTMTNYCKHLCSIKSTYVRVHDAAKVKVMGVDRMRKDRKVPKGTTTNDRKKRVTLSLNNNVSLS